MFRYATAPGRPVVSRSEILQHECDRHHQRRDEAAAGLVVAAQEDVDPRRQRERKQDAGGHHEHHRMAFGRMRHVLLPGAQAMAGMATRGGGQQREDSEARDTQHDDLAQRVEGTEIDQRDIDHIGAAPARIAVGEMILRNRIVGIARQHRPGDRAHGRPAHHGQRAIAHAARHARQCGRRLGQEVERQQQEEDRHHLDRDLRKRKVGRGQVHEGERYDEADDADIDEHAKPLVLCVQHRARRRDQQCPSEDRRGRCLDPLARPGEHAPCPDSLDREQHHYGGHQHQHAL